MLQGRRSKALWIAALVPLFAAAVLPTQAITMVCRFTGIAMDVDACCPSRRTEPLENHARLRGETCCTLKAVDLPKVVSERRSDGTQPRDQQMLAATLVVQAIEFSGRPARARQIGPPPLVPPILLLKCSFLI